MFATVAGTASLCLSVRQRFLVRRIRVRRVEPRRTAAKSRAGQHRAFPAEEAHRFSAQEREGVFTSSWPPPRGRTPSATGGATRLPRSKALGALRSDSNSRLAWDRLRSHGARRRPGAVAAGGRAGAGRGTRCVRWSCGSLWAADERPPRDTGRALIPPPRGRRNGPAACPGTDARGRAYAACSGGSCRKRRLDPPRKTAIGHDLGRVFSRWSVEGSWEPTCFPHCGERTSLAFRYLRSFRPASFGPSGQGDPVRRPGGDRIGFPADMTKLG